METEAVQASENDENYQGAQRVWKLNSLSLQGKEGYYCEKLKLSFQSLYWSSSYWNQRKGSC